MGGIAACISRWKLVKADSFRYLSLPGIGPFDFIFIAPPQFKKMWSQALLAVDDRPELIASGGIVVVQIDPKEQKDLPLQRIIPFDTRKYGNVLLCFYELRRNTDSTFTVPAA